MNIIATVDTGLHSNHNHISLGCRDGLIRWYRVQCTELIVYIALISTLAKLAAPGYKLKNIAPGYKLKNIAPGYKLMNIGTLPPEYDWRHKYDSSW